MTAQIIPQRRIQENMATNPEAVVELPTITDGHMEAQEVIQLFQRIDQSIQKL